ncbi:ABC transporter permease [Croceimicrobium hydrocarbonivorans]|uniref:ABC transporter permease n=1 Tax=Croceimicrobium hydrocarbonivorans TaxID=2761580 RepID=A0A7H0VBZ7_9FLAO|nr:ABC transporter permease [Croceimicrobium hydrocarbonivorans]QNR23245.1 ABC transporter permease [Croceimicrobium hydrocarbonivorans]
MKQFNIFIRKEFWHVFRDPKTMLLLFGMPIAQIVLFGFALTNEIKNVNIAIVDQSGDWAAQELIQKIQANRSFSQGLLLNSEAEVEEAFRRGKVKVAVLIPPNFGLDRRRPEGSQIQIIADASDPNTATTLTNYATVIIQDYQKSDLLPGQGPLQIETQTRMIYNPELKGATNFVPGVMALVLFLVGVLMTSVSIVREKETGTMEVLLVSPFNPILVISAKAVPYFFLSLVNLTVILILSVLLMDMEIAGSLGLLYLSSALLILTALSLGLLISNSTASQQTAMLISLMAMLLPTVMLTGFMFPLENMPWPLQVISNIVPSKWYYIIVQAIMIKGQGLASVWREMLVLMGMTTVFLTLSIRKFKTRLA